MQKYGEVMILIHYPKSTVFIALISVLLCVLQIILYDIASTQFSFWSCMQITLLNSFWDCGISLITC